MAGRLPGPVGADFDHTPRIDSGTLALVQSPRPGVVGQELAHGVHGYAYQEHDLRWTQTLDAAEAIWQALKASQPMVGAIVLQETGVALTHIVQGLIPGLMMAVGVVAASTVIGAAAGAAVGALAGGVGAAPGGALGGQVGFDAGMAGLALLGLGFLAEGFVSGLPGLRAQGELGIRRAVNSLFVPAAARPMEIQEASRHLAQAQAQLLKLVLMAVVAWLLKNPTLAAGKQAASSATGAASAMRSGEALATAEANVAQLVAKLRASRLGAGFADWVEGNWRSLVENPRLRPRVMQAGGAAKQVEVVTPSQLAKMRNAQQPSPSTEQPPKQVGTSKKPAQSTAANPHASFEDVYKKAPAAKVEIDATADEVASKYGGKVAKAPIKSVERAQQKIAADYGGDPTKIKDLARNTIIVRPENIEAVTKDLASKGAKVKAISPTIDDLGYSGVNSTIQTRAGIPAEIQVNSPEMIFAKEPEPLARALLGDGQYDAIASKSPVPGGLGHKYYEEWRVLEDKSTPAAEAIQQASRSYYDAIRSLYGN